MRASLEFYRRGGLTEKNLAVIRQVVSGDVWREVVNLPAALMAQARLLREQAPVKAAVTAQLAVAIGILTFAPVRLGNLVQIRLDQNLIKPGGLNAPYMLVFPDYDVKNRVNLEFPFDDELTALIDEYVHQFRSIIAARIERALAISRRERRLQGRQDLQRADHANGSKRPPACASPCTSFATPPRRCGSSTSPAITKPSGACWDTAISRPR